MEKSEFELTPLIYDIRQEYKELRNDGLSQNKSREIILGEYSEEITDSEDRLSVFIGLALGSSDCDDMSTEMRTAVELRLLKEIENETWGETGKRYFSSVLKRIEKAYNSYHPVKSKKRIKYVSAWKIGDTFAHEITSTGKNVLKTGIGGMYIIFRKIGSYNDNKDRQHELVFITFCSSNSLPKNCEDLERLGFLRVMAHDYGFEYDVQISFSSKKDELAWGLKYIGNFPVVRLPSDRIFVNPQVAVPFFNIVHDGLTWPCYEDTAALYLKDNGMYFHEDWLPLDTPIETVLNDKLNVEIIS